jgi:hypothetical protein
MMTPQKPSPEKELPQDPSHQPKEIPRKTPVPEVPTWPQEPDEIPLPEVPHPEIIIEE